MKRSLLPFVFFACMMLMLCSCRNLFVQKSVFVPLLKEQGEMKAEVSCGPEGAGINSAYAVNDRFSVMLNTFGTFRNSDVYDRKYNIQFETAIGYYKVFPDSLCYEVYAGLGRGWLSTDHQRPVEEFGRNLDIGIFSPRNGTFASVPFLVDHSAYTYRVNAKGSYLTAFLQHDFGMVKSSSKGNSIVWTLRAQYVLFDHYREKVLTGDRTFDYDVYPREKLFIQPVLTDKINISRQWMITLQAGMNFDVTDNTADVFEWNRVFCYAGVQYTFYPKARSLKVRDVPRKNIFQKGY
jgi:hypothetical protein